jgi:hypothetical protein
LLEKSPGRYDRSPLLPSVEDVGEGVDGGLERGAADGLSVGVTTGGTVGVADGF